MPGQVTDTTTQYFMNEAPCDMVDNDTNLRIDEEVFYKTGDAAKRVLEIIANPTVLDLGGPSSIPCINNNHLITLTTYYFLVWYPHSHSELFAELYNTVYSPYISVEIGRDSLYQYVFIYID